MEIVWIEWNQWPVNWPPSASYIAWWDPNEPATFKIADEVCSQHVWSVHSGRNRRDW